MWNLEFSNNSRFWDFLTFPQNLQIFHFFKVKIAFERRGYHLHTWKNNQKSLIGSELEHVKQNKNIVAVRMIGRQIPLMTS